jgi:hypothetical protein
MNPGAFPLSPAISSLKAFFTRQTDEEFEKKGRYNPPCTAQGNDFR